MFTKPELQIIAKTLLQRREWLAKNINSPEMASNKAINQQTLEIIDSALVKLGVGQKPAQPPAPQVIPVDTTTSGAAKLVKAAATKKRGQLEPAEIRVLVVDDDALIASLLQTLLQSVGIKTVHIAEDGLKAISMLYEVQPVYDLVLCDWNMPIKNGLDVHNAMRAAERYSDTCFMLVTAVTEAKQIRAAIEEGVDDYVVKPIEENKILKKIARHFPKIPVPEGE